MRRLDHKALWALFALAWAGTATGQMSEEEELALVYGDKSFVSIATGTHVPVTRAPAVASVVTAEDIKAIGARDLDEALETVPGLHALRLLTYGNKPIYSIRGIATQHNPQVLMLINGIPMTSVYLGDRGDVWGGMPVENIARIEVIRGPGSALYGADAFSGAINIITKTARDIDGTEAGLRAGSFRTGEAWALHGGKLGPVDMAAYLRLGTTDGYKRTIEADAQTAVDAALGTRASLAPEQTSLGLNAFDGQLDLAYGKWQFRTAYKRRDDVETGAGVASALDPRGRNLSERFTSDLTYHDRDFAKDWDITLQASYFRLSAQSDLTVFPPGAVFLGPFPDGVIGNPAKWERHGRFTGSAFYTGFDKHRIRLGAGHETQDLYRTRESKNFALVFVPGVGNLPAPLGSVVDVSGTAPFLLPHKRDLDYLYAQDEWNFAKDWTLTAGLRHDNYSDFGDTTNPRLALVWEAAYNLTAKLLYGRAFRAPSFVELYAINNPVAAGNPNLKPETIDTLEAAFAWQPKADVQLGLGLFRYVMRDILRFVPNADPTTGATAQNTGRQHGRGLELEAAWDVAKNLRLSGNYAWQRSIDSASGQDAGLAPRQHLYVRADWRPAAGWLLNAQANRVADRRREPGDARPPVADYTLTDLTLRTLRGLDRWDFALSVRNLFDVAAREPSPSPGLIPNDFPLPGRSLFLEARHRL